MNINDISLPKELVLPKNRISIVPLYVRSPDFLRTGERIKLVHNLPPCFFLDTRQKYFHYNDSFKLVYLGYSETVCHTHFHNDFSLRFFQQGAGGVVTVDIKFGDVFYEYPSIPELPRQLKFPKNKIFTRRLDVCSASFKRNKKIKVEHNLPANFIMDLPEKYIQMERKVHITFNGIVNETMPEDMFIKFTQKDVEIKVMMMFKTKADEEMERDEFDPLKCPKCSIDFGKALDRKPMILNKCGHSICYQCSRSDKIKCPSCGIVSTGKPEENDSLVLLLGQDRIKTHFPTQKKELLAPKENAPCSECSTENKFQGSTGYCLDCRSDFCHECYVKVHMTSRVFSKHKLVPFYEKPIVQPTCAHHRGQEARMMCDTVNCRKRHEVFCFNCTFQKHMHTNNIDVVQRTHDNFQKIEDAMLKLSVNLYTFRQRLFLLKYAKNRFLLDYEQHEEALQKPAAKECSWRHKEKVEDDIDRDIASLTKDIGEIDSRVFRLKSILARRDNLLNVTQELDDAQDDIDKECDDIEYEYETPYKFPANCYDNNRVPAVLPPHARPGYLPPTGCKAGINRRR